MKTAEEWELQVRAAAHYPEDEVLALIRAIQEDASRASFPRQVCAGKADCASLIGTHPLPPAKSSRSISEMHMEPVATAPVSYPECTCDKGVVLNRTEPARSCFGCTHCQRHDDEGELIYCSLREKNKAPGYAVGCDEFAALPTPAPCVESDKCEHPAFILATLRAVNAALNRGNKA